MAFILSEAECEEAVLLFGSLFYGHQSVNQFPTGCYIMTGGVGRYNAHKSGSGHKETQSICKG